MSDDDIWANLLASSDDRLAAIIFAATGLPATHADLRAWRSALRRLLHRARRKHERDPLPPIEVLVHVDQVRELVIDFLTSPEGLLLFTSGAALGCAPGALTIAVIGAARARYAVLAAAHGFDPAALDSACAYAAAKATPGGATVADYWLAARVDPDIRAALHAATPDRLAWWIGRLQSARGAARPTDGVLRALAADGADVKAAYPDLDLSAVCYGPPLGLWPPPPAEPAAGASDPGWRR